MTYTFETEYGRIEVIERSGTWPNGCVYFHAQDYETTFEDALNTFKDMYGMKFSVHLPICGHSSKDASIDVWLPREIGRVKG